MTVRKWFQVTTSSVFPKCLAILDYWDGIHQNLAALYWITPWVSILSMSLFRALPSLRARECVLARGYPTIGVEGRGERWRTILSNWLLDQWLECWSPDSRSGACSHSGDKMSRTQGIGMNFCRTHFCWKTTGDVQYARVFTLCCIRVFVGVSIRMFHLYIRSKFYIDNISQLIIYILCIHISYSWRMFKR